VSRKEERRFLVLSLVLAGQLTNREAAERLNLSVRQIIRLKKGVKEQGLKALIHKNRGRKPAHALPETLRQNVIQLAKEKYQGVNYTHLTELLAEREGIMLSVSSVRRILKGAGVASPRKRRPNRPHRMRSRKPRAGMLVQMDGSRHVWIKELGRHIVLHAAIDDATGIITGACFREEECLEGYLTVLDQTLRHHGVPVDIYTDRHTLFVSPKEAKLTLEDELAGRSAPLTQFGRVLAELGIGHIRAHSPQAKGRIERLFQTLQDRLEAEMRFAGIATLEEANAFLEAFIPRFNKRFAVEAADPSPAWRPAPSDHERENILCWKETRTVRGGVLSFEGQLYRIQAKGSSHPPVKGKVVVQKRLDGSLKAEWKGEVYDLERVERANFQSSPKPQTAKQKGAGPTPRRKPTKPAPNHPWRRYAPPQSLRCTSMVTQPEKEREDESRLNDSEDKGTFQDGP